MIKIIACVGKNMELGKRGGLCFNIHADMKYFRDTTMGCPVIMGYRTWKSIGKPLRGRKNYVMINRPAELPDEVFPVTDGEDFIKRLATIDMPCFVIGGASAYKMALPYVDEIYLTEVDAEDPEADVFFPEFDKSLYSREARFGIEDGLGFAFVKYKRKVM